MTSLIKQILCINLASREDRLQHMVTQSNQHEFSFKLIEACTPEKAKENSTFVAFNTSQQWALEALTDFPAMILEDDCVFENMDHLEDAMGELPDDFDALYFGANLLGIDVIPFRPPVRFSKHLFTIQDAWMTHAIVYSEKGANKILNKFSVTCGYNYDEFLRQQIIPDGKCFIIAPQIAYQKAGHSDIWGNEGSYEHLFQQGNKLLR